MSPSPRLPLLPLALGAALLALAAPARADVLELVDGRNVEGIVVKEGETYLVRSRFGVTEVPVASVRAHHQAVSLDRQISDHLQKLDIDDTENRALLARWLTEVGRAEEGRSMAEAILESDPENAVAHEVLGHVRHQGVWRTPDEARRAEGLEKHGDQWYSPEEWARVSDRDRQAALEQERRAHAAELQADVNTAVRLMTSPDALLRQRGRAKLESLAAELENPRLLELARHVEAYVKQADEIEAAASTGGVDGTGLVLGEFRATLSRLKRPIDTFETSLASNIGGAPVRIQLPELEVIRVRTTAAIPAVIR
jgi:hypothetical protein